MKWIYHYLNPLHIYCRLRGVGIKKPRAERMAMHYEKWFYNKLFKRRKHE